VSELPDDAARELLLRDELGFAPHAPVALRVEKLEHERPIGIEQRDAAVEHELAPADARRKLVQAEREPRRERTLAERRELLRRVNDLGERAADGTARADAEEILGRRIDVGDEQRVVEDDQRRREALQDAIRARRAARAPAEGRDLAALG
jgi:hypothetical protein